MRLTAYQAQALRVKMLAEQNGQCVLCCYPCAASEAVLDHDHRHGHVRGVLHRGCNAMLGVIENNRARFLLGGPRMESMLGRVGLYINRDFSGNPLYHTFRSEEEKRVRRATKARKARVVKKEKASA